MAEEWLIDGYNLWHETKREETRSRLSPAFLARIADFAAARDARVLVVLDGQGSDEEFRPYSTDQFSIVFSKDITADSYIERRLFQNKGKMTMRVVTRDRALSNVARGSGAYVTDPATFNEMLADSKKGEGNILFEEKVRGHGFSRPFEQALKKKGLI